EASHQDENQAKDLMTLMQKMRRPSRSPSERLVAKQRAVRGTHRNPATVHLVPEKDTVTDQGNADVPQTISIPASIFQACRLM
ncbi:hypothetical protein LTR61_012088, partial [Exophiala xenobiotica]